MVPEIWSETEFFVIFGHFLPFYQPPSASPSPLKISKIKVLKKKMKQMHADILLYIYVYYKWRLYDIWFLKYKMRQTKIFVILGYFCHFSSLSTWKIKILNWKKHLEILSFYTWQSYDIIWCMFPEIWGMTDIILCHPGPSWTQKIKIFKKWKRHLEILSFYTCLP